MGDNLYTAYWEGLLPQIIKQLSDNNTVNLFVKGLAALGNRQSYYASFIINNGQLLISNNAYAQGRDLYAVLSASDYFKQQLNDKNIQVTISKELTLTMEMSDTNESPINVNLYQLKAQFLETFPITRLENLTLDEYTNLDKSTSFCYWLEARTQDLGSIWGGSSYKFGVYRKNSAETDPRPSYKTDGIYAWTSKYGATAQQAFDAIKQLILTTATNAQQNKFDIIDGIDLGDAYKWKIAFLYSNYNVTNIFKPSTLFKAASLNGFNGKLSKIPISVVQQYLIDKKPSELDYFDYVHGLWAQVGQQPDQPLSLSVIESENLKTMSLNTILYGPPGTGKTYHTINRSVAIANPEFNFTGKSRKDIKNEYKRLVEAKQIVFTTFHQSMGYEDFIEGIKPLPPSPDDTFVKYDVVPGIFKKICDNARYKPDVQINKFHISADEFNKTTFFKISLGNTDLPEDEDIYKYCIKNNCIALGWGGSTDYTGFNENETVKKAWENEGARYPVTAIKYFTHHLKVGNYVLISNGNNYCRAIAKVTGDYYYKQTEEIDYCQFRPVEWLITDVDIPVSQIYQKVFSQQTIYKLGKQNIKLDFFVKNADEIKKEETKKPKNHVLIIDEINRGNVSQIFGELITLIEDDKREGCPEEIKLTLPYSKQEFSVPANLFIIGTMNTADRSVEALDTALRRRFNFIEMAPKPELVSAQELVARLWWEYPEVEWDDKDYLPKEESLYKLLGADDLIEMSIKDKEKLWYNMYDDGMDSSVFDGLNFTNIDFKKLLETINLRLEKLISRDHTIGHSFYLNICTTEDLYSAFYNKIIPQLQEYFFGDYGKIGLVLGEAFFDTAPIISFAKFKQYEDADMLLEKNVYRLKSFLNPDGEIDDIGFTEAVKGITT